MSQRERKLLDKQGKFLQVVQSGRTKEEVGWIPGRILLSDKRLVLAGNQGKRTIPVSAFNDIGDRYDVNQAIARVSTYTALQYEDNNVLLLSSSKEPEEIEEAVFRALLDHKMILARHPAVEGGVLQDTDWHRAQVKIDHEEESVAVALTDGTFSEIELDDIGTLSTSEQLVMEENRPVLKVEHSTDDGTSVETHLSGTERRCRFLEALLREGEERSEVSVELSYREEKVLMALHSGVSPFEIPGFVGMDVEEVEEVYERLIDIEALEEIRKRREVEMTARGRKIAGGAMDDE